MTSQPWSIPVRTIEVGRGVHRRLEADAVARARIARALDLAALDRLEAEVSVAPVGDGFEVRGVIEAALAQTCGVTLEPLPGEIRADFAVRCRESAGEDESERAEVVVALEDEDPPDPIENGVIDLGAYVVEHLALELDPFPRKPDAVFEPPAAEAEPSPFAVLAKLKREQGD